MNEQIHEKLKEIKQSFRLLMNGVASHKKGNKASPPAPLQREGSNMSANYIVL